MSAPLPQSLPPSTPAFSRRAIRVLIIDDSAVARELLRDILESDAGITVVGTARDGEEGARLAAALQPDLITMDLHMPGLNGFETTQRIMQAHAVPIVVVSGIVDASESKDGFDAIAAGAVVVIRRPPGLGHADFDQESRLLIKTIKTMAEVKVVRRWTPSRPHVNRGPAPARPNSLPTPDIVAIGASTGGPQVLQVILSQLPRGLPFPLVIVQHMSDGFMAGFVDWLARSCPLPLHLAKTGTLMKSGEVYFAPDGFHLEIAPAGHLRLTSAPAENGMRPAVSVLFRSVAERYRERCLAILLTGMGVDGAVELGDLRQLGATTVAQDEETSVVFGMPGEAVRLGAARSILPPHEIASLLRSFAPAASSTKISRP